MIYEERTYKVMPGRMSDILKRFQDHAVRIFERHGMKLIGFWLPMIGPDNYSLTYLLAFEDLAHRERAWAAFYADQEWIRIKKETEANGALFSHISNRILAPTPFSPLR